MSQLDTLPARFEEILRGIVEEYVRLAMPVSSTHLAGRLQLPASSATVRNVMHDLEEAGYIYQPHTSAGRVPTDKGYRYYVDRLGHRSPAASQLLQIERRYQRLAQQYTQLHRAMAKLVAHLSQSVAVGYRLPDKDVYEAGLRQLLDQPEAQEKGAMREVSDFLENVDDYVEQLAPADDESSLVFIGQENPAYDGTHTSLILRTINLGNGQHLILAIIGPKRMPYRQHVDLLEGIARFIEREQEH